MLAQNIINKVCKYYGTDVKLIYQKLRTNDVVLSRHVAMYLVNKSLKISHSDMAKIFQKDRTSVLHGVSRIESLLSLRHEVDIKKDVENIYFLLQMH